LDWLAVLLVWTMLKRPLEHHQDWKLELFARSSSYLPHLELAAVVPSITGAVFCLTAGQVKLVKTWLVAAVADKSQTAPYEAVKLVVILVLLTSQQAPLSLAPEVMAPAIGKFALNKPVFAVELPA